jgi:glycosyltransferase involved in cell wall biosynthesis
MKILFITEHFYPHIGGAEKLLLDLASSLVRHGHDVRVLTSNSGGAKGSHAYNGINIHSYRWNTFFGHPIPSKNDIYPQISWADIVQTAQYTAAPTALKCAKKMNKPCVMMSYEYLGKRWRQVDSPIRAKLFELFEWWVFHKPYDKFVAISKSSKKDLLRSKINPSKVSVVYPVFNDFNFWKTKNKPSVKSLKTFLFYGRPGKTKGVFILLEAIKNLNKTLTKDINFSFILSDDPLKEKKRLIALVDKYQLNDRITILDSQSQDELKNSIIESYCVIVPSLTEGFGYSAYQACMLGKNIIVSDAGSLPEVISGNCLIFKNGDSNSLELAIKKASNGKFVSYTDRIGGDNTKKMVELYTGLIQ